MALDLPTARRRRKVQGARSETPTTSPNTSLSRCHPIAAPGAASGDDQDVIDYRHHVMKTIGEPSTGPKAPDGQVYDWGTWGNMLRRALRNSKNHSHPAAHKANVAQLRSKAGVR